MSKYYSFFLLFIVFLGATSFFTESSLFAIIAKNEKTISNIYQDSYDVINGGAIDIPNGSIVEGSIGHGGMQPNYIIDYSSIEFNELKKFSRKLKNDSKTSFFEKAWNIQNYISQNILKNKNYDNSNYLALIKKFREQKKNVPLSEYRVCSSGVCREHALIYHMALKEAGIENYHMYVIIYNGDRIEDHAVNIVKYKGEDWILDSYNKNFNGHLLSEALGPEGLAGKKSIFPKIPLNFTNRGFKQINDYPKIYIPKASKHHNFNSILNKTIERCQNLFERLITDFNNLGYSRSKFLHST